MRNTVLFILLLMFVFGCSKTETNNKSVSESNENDYYKQKILGTWIENYSELVEEEGRNYTYSWKGETTFLRNGKCNSFITNTYYYHDDPDLEIMVLELSATKTWEIKDGTLYTTIIDSKIWHNMETSVFNQAYVLNQDDASEYKTNLKRLANSARGVDDSCEILKLNDDVLIIRNDRGITLTFNRKPLVVANNTHIKSASKSTNEDYYKEKILGVWKVNQSFSTNDKDGLKMVMNVEGEDTYLRNGKSDYQGSVSIEYPDDPDWGTVVFNIWITATWEIKDRFLFDTLIDSKFVPNLEKSTNLEAVSDYETLIKELMPKGLSSSSEIIKLDDKVLIIKDESDGSVFSVTRKLETKTLVCPKCKKLRSLGDVFCKDDGERLVNENSNMKTNTYHERDLSYIPRNDIRRVIVGRGKEAILSVKHEREEGIRNALSNMKGDIKLIGWHVKKIDEQKYLVSYVYELNKRKRGWYYEVIITDGYRRIVRDVWKDSLLIKRYGIDYKQRPAYKVNKSNSYPPYTQYPPIILPYRQ